MRNIGTHHLRHPLLNLVEIQPSTARKNHLILEAVTYTGDRGVKINYSQNSLHPALGANIFTTQIMNALARVSKIKTNPSAPSRVVSTLTPCVLRTRVSDGIKSSKIRSHSMVGGSQILRTALMSLVQQ